MPSVSSPLEPNACAFGLARILRATALGAAVVLTSAFAGTAATAAPAQTSAHTSVAVRTVFISEAPATVLAQSNAAAQATDAATAAPAASNAAAAPADSGGIPGWVWLLAALIVLGLIFAYVRRNKKPAGTTDGTGGAGEPKITTRH